MLKSKSSRWLAGPYLVWMAIFYSCTAFHRHLVRHDKRGRPAHLRQPHPDRAVFQRVCPQP